METARKPTLMLIDGHSLAFRAFYALPTESFVTPEGQHTNAIHGFLSMLLSLLKNEAPTHLAVAFDISRYSFRTREYPDYKATRGETPPEFVGQVPLLQDALHAMGVTTLTKEDYEADDIIATLATQGAQAGFDVLVVSGDRDTLQLVTPEVTVLYPSSRGVSELKRYTPQAVVERYGVPPERYPDIAALVGETSDNLVGIDKVGEKTAVKWITQYGSLDEVLAHADDITGVVGNNLREQRERAVLNRKLNALVRDVDLEVRPDELERGAIDVEAVKEVFGSLRFRTLTERVLALAGEQPDSVSAVAGDLAAPEAKMLLDEELAHWLASHTGELSISVAGTGGGLTLGISDGLELVVVRDTSGSQYAAPLQEALSDPSRSWWWWHAKASFHALHRAGWTPPTAVGGDLRLAVWLEAPGRKVPTLDDLCEARLGARPRRSDQDTLVDMGEGVDESAWWIHQLYPLVRGELPESQSEILEQMELPLVPILWRMEVDGIASDTDALRALDQRLLAEAEAHQRAAFEAIGHEVNLGSPKQLQVVLFEELGMPKNPTNQDGFFHRSAGA